MQGGGFYISGGSTTLSNCVVSSNSAVSDDPLVGHCSLNPLTNTTPSIIPFAGEYGMVLCCGICCFAMGMCLDDDDGRCRV